MTFLIVTHAAHNEYEGKYFAYGPYIREMNLWIKDTDQVLIIAPLNKAEPGAIDLFYQHDNINFIPVPSFSIQGAGSVLSTILKLPVLFFKTFMAMRKASHIHLRCPGNMGLIGLIVQVLFPFKKKTVKYAGNWDNYEGEHISYKMQKRMSKNTFLSRNTQVLIYGQWPDFTKNCLPFFTASYREKDKEPVHYRTTKDPLINLVFLGTLDERKRPEYAIEAISILEKKGFKNVHLDIVGDGPFAKLCEEKINQFGLQEKVTLHGNIPPSQVSTFLDRAHMLIFLSRMEGWPKVVAESMWWGCVPVTTAVSCVPWMLNYGTRGVLVDRTPEAAAEAISLLLNDPEKYALMQAGAVEWSRQYTLERFESQVKTLL